MEIDKLNQQEDVYNKQVQDILFQLLEDGKYNQAVAEGIKIHNDRSSIMYGLYRRSLLKSATSFKWKDPRYADGVPIFAREAYSTTKENHKIHTPFDRVISMQKAAYMVGITPEPIIEEREDQEQEIMKQIRGLGFDETINELAQKSTSRGNAFVLLSSPKGSKEAYLSLVDEWSCFIVYDTALNEPRYGIRYWYDDNISLDTICGELYTVNGVYKFEGTKDDIRVNPDGELHLFQGVPLIEFPNNTDRMGDVELTLSEQDAFDIADSDISSEVSQLRLAYLNLLSEEQDVDDDFMTNLTQAGVIIGEAKFIEKNLNSQAVENLKTDLERRIYKYSNSYNADELGSDKALTAFQIQQKLIGLESSSKETEMSYRVSLTRLFSLLLGFYDVKLDKQSLSWKFTRNTPRNVLEDISKAVESGFRFSQKMIARLLPFEFNQVANEEELEEEKSSQVGEFNINNELPKSE